MADVHGSWQPLTLAVVRALFDASPRRWWISGGLALELGVGSTWRPHEDTDVSLCRGDLGALRSILPGWDIWVAAAGVLRQWAGEPLTAERHENNLWCRPTPEDAWQLDVTVSEGDADEWVYRRDPTLRLPWDQAVLYTADGVPYLAPALQLLFKSKGPRAKDDLDAEVVIPGLSSVQRDLLRQWLPAGHPWHALLG